MHVMTPGTLRPEEKVKVEGLLCNPSTILMEKPGASQPAHVSRQASMP
jgi:hypothetical protein